MRLPGAQEHQSSCQPRWPLHIYARMLNSRVARPLSVQLCTCGGIGRRTGFRLQYSSSVRVRVSPGVRGVVCCRTRSCILSLVEGSFSSRHKLVTCARAFLSMKPPPETRWRFFFARVDLLILYRVYSVVLIARVHGVLRGNVV